MTRDQWAARVADVVIEIASDAAVEIVAAAQGHGGYTHHELARKKLRQELIFLLSELPE